MKRAVIQIRPGPVVKHRNGFTGPRDIALLLECGHKVVKKPSAVSSRPTFCRCRECK
jgi:hypothetical protein